MKPREVASSDASGTTSVTPDRIKRFRLKNNSIIRNESSREFHRYRQMIDEVTIQLRRCIVFHHANERSPRFEGGANIYSEVVWHEGSAYFLKTTTSLLDNELAFYTALMSGMIEQESHSHLIPKPVSITQIDGFRVYAFPYYDFQPLTINDFTEARRHDLISCIARFNSAHLGTPELRQVFRSRRYICRISAEAIEAAFPQRETHVCRVLHQRIAAIFETFSQTIKIRSGSGKAKRKQASLCLCVNDFSHQNVGLLEAEQQERFAFLDMGQACLAPLGADLRWFFHYAIRQGQELGELRRIAGDYHEVIREKGVETSLEAIYLAGLAAYADKRFNLKLLSPTSDAQADLNWGLLHESVELVERCLADLRGRRFRQISISTPNMPSSTARVEQVRSERGSEPGATSAESQTFSES